RGSVAIPHDHLGQLSQCLVEHLLVLKVDALVDGDLGPNEQPDAISHPRHMFIVRIMSQAHEVASQILGPTEQRRCVVVATGPSATIGGIFMYRDTAEKHRTPVKENFSSASLNGSEADFFTDLIGIGRKLYPIESRVLWGPQLHALCVQLEMS